MARGYSYGGDNLIEDEAGNIRPRVPKIIDARAPMHDPAQDRPMSPDSLTPKGIWDRMFRNSQTGNNPLAPAASQPSTSFVTAPRQSQPPSLTTLAAGGMNHQQAWMSGEARAAQGQLDVAKYRTPGTIAMTTYAGANGVAPKVSQNDPTLDPELRKRFSWATAFGQ